MQLLIVPVEIVVHPEPQLEQSDSVDPPVLDLYVPTGQGTGPVPPGQ